jgi:hypothetical protein
MLANQETDMTSSLFVNSGKPALVPRSPPQIPYGLIWDRSSAAAVGNLRLTAWATARPYAFVTSCSELCKDVSYSHAFEITRRFSETALFPKSKFGRINSKLTSPLYDSQIHERVKYGHESRGTRKLEWLCWRGPAKIYRTRPTAVLHHAMTAYDECRQRSMHIQSHHYM